MGRYSKVYKVHVTHCGSYHHKPQKNALYSSQHIVDICSILMLKIVTILILSVIISTKNRGVIIMIKLIDLHRLPGYDRPLLFYFP